MPIAESELVLNADGSIYHLNLHPEQVADTVFFVGDPGRVPRVSKYFDKIEHCVQRREFVTHTGWLGSRRLSVISTGIGPDNIDIVMNELDALANIDFATKTVKDKLTRLRIIRLGTSGSLSENIPVDSLVVSVFGIGLDNMLSFYGYEHDGEEAQLNLAFTDFISSFEMSLRPNVAKGSTELVSLLKGGMAEGITLTCAGFYGPQGRRLRLGSIIDTDFFRQAGNFSFQGLHLSNFEMETAAIFGLAKMMGHQATSCNAILANRVNNVFSKNPGAAVEQLIKNVLEKIVAV
ncbi:MAG: nucleoside phosphorylase [Lewinellaceae bacterium]|nr:nucleoside phosphorylase [Saprospiraceae bacterium]MCB9336831.1 nucleoside phosphorylase [Lewinellaceae bacterium]